MLNLIKNQLEKSVVPLCLSDDGHKIKLHGSSLYFTYNSKFYLSTAAHVLYRDDNNTQLCCIDFIYPTGNEFVSLPSFHLAKDENLDICLLELSVPLQAFIPFDMNNYHFTNSNTHFCCIGYPGKRTKQFKNNSNSILKFYYTEKETKKAFIKNLQKFEIPLRFIKSKCIRIDGTPIIFPAPEGMSGGPLVAFENGNYLIYGVLTRWGDKLKRTMYATVVDYRHLLDNL